ncbi:MAG: alpha/beta hydrolase [Reyranella sp.]|uniref:alpha/beta fold hydrolase n=1 Tax=Reyranella sp. TaxID=1929291 RepID=UPI001AC3D9AD|nr:alpha/beta hydrolase [Reyranella sp.]MBN9086318.1 alpha/beta hydrolase [Reyranella sp.]
MIRFVQAIVALLLAAQLVAPQASAQSERWMTLPPTPSLPVPTQAARAEVNGASIWYAMFGSGPPVVLLHGGLANSSYWGHQVPALAQKYQVIVIDSRGHGRSTRDAKPYGYELMASDVLGVLDKLAIPKAAIVGWSDGAIIGLSLAMNHPERVSRLFAFAANSDPSGVKDVDKSPVFQAFIARAEKEYEALSATPKEYKQFVEEISGMWSKQPKWTKADLEKIKVPTWIVDADHDEAIERGNTELMAESIPRAGLLLQPEVSHFSMLQDPAQFTADVMRFLERTW